MQMRGVRLTRSLHRARRDRRVERVRPVRGGPGGFARALEQGLRPGREADEREDAPGAQLVAQALAGEQALHGCGYEPTAFAAAPVEQHLAREPAEVAREPALERKPETLPAAREERRRQERPHTLAQRPLAHPAAEFVRERHPRHPLEDVVIEWVA